jgi:glycosyltransferase involved in cell wall biosynthesis
MEPRKLLIITPAFPDRLNADIGGIFIKEQVDYLKDYFAEINVIALYSLRRSFLNKAHYANYSWDNIYVYYIPTVDLPQSFAPNFLKSLLLKIENEEILKFIRTKDIEFDLIHAHFTWPSGAIAVQLKKIFNVPVVITEHTSMTFERAIRKKDPEYINAWELSDSIIRVRNGDMNLFKSVGISLDKVSYIPNGFDERKFAMPDDKMDSDTFNLFHNKKILLSVGNLYSEVKGHKFLIEAMNEIVKYRKDILCVIVGNGKLTTEVEEQIQELNLDNYIKLVGAKPHDEIPFWMSIGDIFVLPSLNEGNPTVMFEALGSGKPFIGTRVGGVPEIIVNGKLGILVEAGDPERLAQAILMALATEWDAEYIRDYAQQFTWENIARQLMVVYETVMRSNMPRLPISESVCISKDSLSESSNQLAC